MRTAVLLLLLATRPSFAQEEPKALKVLDGVGGISYDGPLITFVTLSIHGDIDAILEGLAGVKTLKRISLCGSPVTTKGLAHLKKYPVLETVELTYLRMGDADLKSLADIKTLRTLDVQNSRVSGTGLASLTELTALDLSSCPVNEEGMKAVGGLSKLRNLNLTGTSPTAKGIRELKNLKVLGQLLMYGNATNDETVAALLEIDQFHTLTKVCLGKKDPTILDFHRTAVTSVKNLVRFKNVEILSLAHCPVRELELKDWPKLRGLDLTGTGVADIKNLPMGLKELRLGSTGVQDVKEIAGCKSLRNLDLSGTKIKEVKDLAGLADLEVLNLGRSAIADASLKDLSGLKKLRSLSLFRTGLTDVSLETIRGMGGLKDLDLRGTKVSRSGLSELQKARPELKVKWLPRKEK